MYYILQFTLFRLIISVFLLGEKEKSTAQTDFYIFFIDYSSFFSLVKPAFLVFR